MTIPDEPTEELIKEVYARFGLAYYHSECLHQGLCIIHAIASFKGPGGITRPRVEEKLPDAYSLTLGQVKDELKALIPDELFRRLDEAVAERNFLAHHFWFERCHLMFRATRLRQMIEELDEYSDLFRRFDRMAEEYVLPKMKELGIGGEEFQRCLQEVISGEPMEPFPTKRKLRKRERVVRVWEFAIADEGKPLIFETDDGCFWQLSDVGLGWTYYDQVKPDWKENKTIGQYLPANIDPRPKDSTAWNYEFKLAKGAILWLRPGKRKRSFTWGIRIEQKKTERHA